MSFRTSKLQEVADIIDSLHKTPKYADQGYPMVRCTDVKYGVLDLKNTFKVDPDVFREFSRRYKPQIGDVVITRVGSYGNTAIAKDTIFCLGQNTAAIVPKIDSHFLYAALNSPFVKSQIEHSVVGSTQKTLSLKAIGNLEIPRFGAETENAIAQTAKNLDEKIELNRQINQTLEQIAQAIFKSWFVDFDPVKAKIWANENGHDPERAAMCALAGLPYADNALDHLSPEQQQQLATTAALFPNSLEESELGEIPSGWKPRHLSDFGNVVCGKTPPKSNPDFYGSDVPFIKIPDMHGKVFVTKPNEFLSNAGAKSQYKKVIPKGSICVSCIATVGLVCMTHQECCTNQQINSILPNKQYYSEYLYFSLRDLSQLLHDLASGGSATLNLNTGNFSKIQIPTSNDELLAAFSGLVCPLFQNILLNQTEADVLTLLRDTLLPKLLSGELSVADLPEVADAGASA